MVGNPAHGAWMRFHLHLYPRTLPAAHAREARTTDRGIRSVEKHRRAGRRVAREVRLAVFARAARAKGGKGRAARRTAAES